MKSGARIGLYFGLLALAGGLADPNGGLADLPLLFILKDHLHLEPQLVAVFGAITVIPRHLGFLFGFWRDWWRPVRLGDRGFFLMVAALVTGCYLWLAFMSATFVSLLAAVFLITIAFQVFDTSTHALLTIVAQRQFMTGRMTAFMEIADNTVSVAAVLAGGWLVAHASTQTIFVLAAGVTLLIFIPGSWNPPEIFPDNEDGQHESRVKLRSVAQKIVEGRLWMTIAMLVLYNFSPSWGTPFFYYMTSNLKLSSEAFGVCRAVNYAGIAVATVLYGFLCYRRPLKNLLWWAIILNVFPGFLFLLIRSSWQAVAAAAVWGLITGFGNIAVFDLVMRSCPKKMEGTVSMLAFSIFGLAGTAGDVVGAWIYQNVSFALCIIIDAAATILMLPFLHRLPSSVIAHRDGEAALGPESIEIHTW